jgi:hypothetical protein
MAWTEPAACVDRQGGPRLRGLQLAGYFAVPHALGRWLGAGALTAAQLGTMWGNLSLKGSGPYVAARACAWESGQGRGRTACELRCPCLLATGRLGMAFLVWIKIGQQISSKSSKLGGRATGVWCSGGV